MAPLPGRPPGIDTSLESTAQPPAGSAPPASTPSTVATTPLTPQGQFQDKKQANRLAHRDSCHPGTGSISTAQGGAATTTATTTATAVKWADKLGKVSAKATVKAGHAASTATGQVAAGATKLAGRLDTKTHARGLRPLYVRLSVRVHHVAFLHPGLDDGSKSTIGGRGGGRWRLVEKTKNKQTAPPGLLQFGSKKGDWKNPLGTKRRVSLGGLDSSLNYDREIDAAMDASEVSEIISAEAFRLSRDGMIQHHYALNRAAGQRDDGAGGEVGARDAVRPSILSPASAANPQEAARAYRECAARPKGVRRLVVSSTAPARDAPPPPAEKAAARGRAPGRASCRGAPRNTRSSGVRRGEDDHEDEEGFDHVEYRYVSA